MPQGYAYLDTVSAQTKDGRLTLTSPLTVPAGVAGSDAATMAQIGLPVQIPETIDVVTLPAGGTQAIPDVTLNTMHAYTFGAGNVTFTFPAAARGKRFTLALTQDSVGSRTATWPSTATVRFPAATAPVLSTGANKTDYLEFVCTNGALWDCVSTTLNFAPFVFTPAAVAGLQGWWQADTIAQADATLVSSWADLSTNARALVQATGAKQPTYKTAILNGHAVTRWDGARIMATAGFTLAQPETVFVVAGLTGTGSARSMTDGLTAITMMMDTNATDYDIWAGTALHNPAVPDTSPHIHVGVFNGASSNMRIGGGAGVTGNAGTASPGGVTVGAYAGPGQFWYGDIAEVIVYNTALSLVDMNSVGNYLATRYGLTWTTAT